MANPGLGNVLRRMRWLFRPGEPDPASDRQLLERFAASRDESAFAELVRRHGPMVLGIAQRVLPDRNDAHDAFQAAFLVLVRKAGSAGWHDSIAGWLHRVAFRAALKIKANAQRRRTHETQAVNMAPALLTDPNWKDLRGVLDEELDRLPEKYRTPLVLCYIEGKTNEEAAKSLGWPAGSMSRRLEKGRELLRVRLAKRGVALTGAALVATITPQLATAAVPAALAETTIHAAVGLTTLPTSVLAVADAIGKELMLAKLKIAAAVMLAVGVAGAGAAAVIHQAASQRSGAPAGDDTGLARPIEVRHRTLRLPTDLHKVSIAALAVTPDGKHIAAGSSDHALRLVEQASGQELQRAKWAGPGIARLAFSPDGKLLASASWHGDDQVIIWDVVAQKDHQPWKHHALPIRGHPGGVAALAFSTDGVLAYSANGGGICVARPGTDQRVFLHPRAHVDSLAFSADGKQIATAEGDGHVRLWDTATGKEERAIHARQCQLTGSQAVAFSPDGTLASAGQDDGLVRFWDPNTGRELRQLGDGQAGMIRSVAFSPNGKLLALATMTGIRIHDVATGRELYRQEIDLYARCPVRFSPDGKLLTASMDETIHLWEIAEK